MGEEITREGTALRKAESGIHSRSDPDSPRQRTQGERGTIHWIIREKERRQRRVREREEKERDKQTSKNHIKQTGKSNQVKNLAWKTKDKILLFSIKLATSADN